MLYLNINTGFEFPCIFEQGFEFFNVWTFCNFLVKILTSGFCTEGICGTNSSVFTLPQFKLLVILYDLKPTHIEILEKKKKKKWQNQMS